jgi:hypothetical protein
VKLEFKVEDFVMIKNDDCVLINVLEQSQLCKSRSYDEREHVEESSEKCVYRGRE